MKRIHLALGSIVLLANAAGSSWLPNNFTPRTGAVIPPTTTEPREEILANAPMIHPRLRPYGPLPVPPLPPLLPATKK